MTWVRNFYGAFFVNFEFLTVRSSFVRKNRDTDIQIYRETDKTLNSVAKTSRKAQLRRASRQISVLQKCWRKKSFHTPIIGEYCKFSPKFYHHIKEKNMSVFSLIRSFTHFSMLFLLWIPLKQFPTYLVFRKYCDFNKFIYFHKSTWKVFSKPPYSGIFWNSIWPQKKGTILF